MVYFVYYAHLPSPTSPSSSPPTFHSTQAQLQAQMLGLVGVGLVFKHTHGTIGAALLSLHKTAVSPIEAYADAHTGE